MITLEVAIGTHRCTATLGDARFEAPVGTASLTTTELVSDPPLPEELTNAIGFATDHFEDLLRELPDAAVAERVVVSGPEVLAIAAVEVGGPPDLPIVLSRDAAEDVFRTLATEGSTDRSRNPGLPAHLVDTVVAGCCVLVALMRHLQLSTVWVESVTSDVP